MPPQVLTSASLVPHLKRCRYDNARLEQEYHFGSGVVPIAAFADTPHDARSACIAVIDAPSDPESSVAAVRPLGAPVVFACHADTMQWWKQTTGTPVLIDKVNRAGLQNFFTHNKKELGPDAIFEGKTRLRLPSKKQMSFVDAGLMPFIERTHGERLSELMETAIGDIKGVLNRPLTGERDIQNAIKATFWLLAAKALRDKNVRGFKTVNLTNIDDVFRRVGDHYGVSDDVPPPGQRWHDATTAAAERIGNFDSLRNLSTESLAHVYENSLVTPEVRKALGTHSTPGALVDYIVWQLWPWIEQLPPDRRRVFEPACGHAAFLIGALRVLRQWSGIEDGNARHNYLKQHLYGIEFDPFALEVARLSLTLADIPFGNRWNLKQGDMFAGSYLEEGAQQCGVLLANPPYERFTTAEKTRYSKANLQLRANTKACEMLYRTIPHMTEGACFGLVIPQGLLHNKEGAELRRTLLSGFELSEIDIFGDRLFEKGDHEVAVMMGRRKFSPTASPKTWFRRVRNSNIQDFQERFAFSSEEQVDASRFVDTADFRVPELDGVWRYLSSCPPLRDIGTLGQGLFHKGRNRPDGAWVIHDPPLRGDVLGYANVQDDLSIYDVPKAVGINIASEVVDRAVAGLPSTKPQVLLNYAPVSREAWRLKAVLDQKGLAATNRFIAVRPKANVNAIYLWAVLNSPIANAFAYCFLGKRDILVGTMRKLPTPPWSQTNAAKIEQAAMRYRALSTSQGPLYDNEATPEGIKRALLDMDAAVLRAYDLPPRLERQLLDLFDGVERKGVGCDFNGYYPPGFTSYLPLHMIHSERFQRAAADATADRFIPDESDAVTEALSAAAGMDKE